MRVSIALASLALMLVGCGGSSSGPKPTLRAYLRAWSRQDWAGMVAVVDDPPPDFLEVNTGAWKALGVQSARFAPGAVARHGSEATAPLASHLTLAGWGGLDLHSTVRLRQVRGNWRVSWTPETIDGRLAPGDHFSVHRSWPPRAPVVGASGTSLTSTPEVTVGLVGQRITDAASLATTLASRLGVSIATVQQAVAQAQAHPTWFVPVTTIPDSQYQRIKSEINPLPGTQFTTQSGPLTADLAAHVVGHLGPITSDQLRSLGPPYDATDAVGQNGIEQAYEKQLAGMPSSSVTVVDAAGRSVATLAGHGGSSGSPVHTTLDPTVQQTAEAALNAGPPNLASAMVVVRASTGAILASVSRPTTAAFDTALAGALPPGSTFKVVTSAALLQHGDSPTMMTSCPPTVTVNGQVFHNAEPEAQSTLTFADAFAVSCNTAFITMVQQAGLAGADLAQAAAMFGVGKTPKMGLAAYTGQVPVPAAANDLAATAIGEGRVTVSPLGLAEVAAAIDSGSVHSPRLVAGAPDDTAAPMVLDPSLVNQLRSMMAGVVTGDGTAAGAGLPAGTYGKTGTAEYQNGPSSPSHAWFIGFRGDLAFAVVVEGVPTGQLGGTVAAPLAARLLNALPANL